MIQLKKDISNMKTMIAAYESNNMINNNSNNKNNNATNNYDSNY